MKNKRFFKVALLLLLCLAMVLPYIPLKAEAAVDNFAGVGTGFQGKTLSILGDSISTYYGYSNDATVNDTIGNNAVYYNRAGTKNQFLGSVNDTWWMQAINTLDMNLMVNNSWSGSLVTQDGGDSNADNNNATTAAAWVDRCKQLHDNTGDDAGKEPDIIAVYMGTNDIKIRNLGGSDETTTGYSTFAGSSNASFLEIIAGTKSAGGNNKFTPVLGGYAKMIQNMVDTYENAEIYCFTLLPNWSQPQFNIDQMESFNKNIRQIVDYYQGLEKKVYLVDLYEDSGITNDLDVLEYYMANCLHPNEYGMDAITNCFVSALVENSQYAANTTKYDVTYTLNDAYVQGGNVNVAVAGAAFSVPLLPTRSEYELDVTVKMGGTDITSTAYSGGRVYIANVTGDIEITAEADYNTHNYRWEWKDGLLESATVDGNDYNVIGGIDENKSTVLFTDGYDVVDDVEGDNDDLRWLAGDNDGTQFGLNDSVVLRNDEPWVIEWQETRSWGHGGALFSEGESINELNNSYVYKSSYIGLDSNADTDTDDNLLAFGYYNNYKSWRVYVGLPLKWKSTDATYRLVNQINSDGSNMVYLYVDDVLQGPLNKYYYGTTQLAKKTDDTDYTDNWISGRDFVFSFLGADGKPLAGVKLNYLQVWEGGEFDTLRLEQLIEESNDVLAEMAGGTGYSTYQEKVAAAKNYLNGTKENLSQAKYDALVKDILDARNQITQASDTTMILSAEVVTGDYAHIGKQVGVRIITTPDVEAINVGTQTLTVCTSQLQTMKINGVEMVVKVWLVAWNRDVTNPTTLQYRIKAYKDADVAASEYGSNEGNGYKTSLLMDIQWGANGGDTSVSDLANYAAGDKVTITGYYVGVADEGSGADKEILIKDLSSDDIIAVRGVLKDSLTYSGAAVGNLVKIEATLKVDGTADTPNKRYLGDATITVTDSEVKDITYQLTNTVKVSSWAEMKALFDANKINAYTYIEFTGPMYFTKYESTNDKGWTDEYVTSYRLTMNSKATSLQDSVDTGIKPDGKRSVSLRSNILAANLGENWDKLFFDQITATIEFPGNEFNGSLIALYTGASGSYFQLTVLDESWIGIADNGDVLTEVAYAFYNQGTAIQYDQTQKRRNMNPSPEDATAQNPIYLDCSSYVNAVYNEAFGVNVMPYALSVVGWNPTTENYTAYAKENRDAVDVIGYWENEDYKTDTAISTVLSEVRNQLQVGDVLVYRHGTTSSSGHVYVYVGNDTFLHCSGASYVYNSTTPSESYDYGTQTETGKGAIQIIDSNSIFTTTGTQSSKRYLFNDGDDPVVNFSLLRPLARGLTPTKESINRMKIAGLEAEKSVNVGQYNAVCPGDTLVYTVTLTNNSKVDDVTNVSFKDTLPSSVAVMYGSEGMYCSGQTVSWTGTVKAGKTVTLTYTVKVSESAAAGTLIESNQATVHGVKINDLTNTVSGMSDSELAAIAKTAIAEANEAKKYDNPIDFVQALYPGVMDATTYDAVSKVLSAVIDSNNNTCKTGTGIPEMLVPNLYGGMDIKDGFYTDCDRARLVIEDYLEVGDVIVAAHDSKGYVWVYVGDGQMVYIDSPNDTCMLVDIGSSAYDYDVPETTNVGLKNILATLISYERYAILRPSMVTE